MISDQNCIFYFQILEKADRKDKVDYLKKSIVEEIAPFMNKICDAKVSSFDFETSSPSCGDFQNDLTGKDMLYEIFTKIIQHPDQVKKYQEIP